MREQRDPEVGFVLERAGRSAVILRVIAECMCRVEQEQERSDEQADAGDVPGHPANRRPAPPVTGVFGAGTCHLALSVRAYNAAGAVSHRSPFL